MFDALRLNGSRRSRLYWTVLLFAIGVALVLSTVRSYTPHATVYTRTPQEIGHRIAGDKDAYLYRDIAARVAHGEDYWRAAEAEHRRHHQATAPAVAFREPTLSWVLAGLRTPLAAQALLYAVVILTSFLTWLALQRTNLSNGERVLAVALQLSGLGFAFVPIPLETYSHDTWAGCFIAISLALWRLDALIPAVAVGIIACLFRELALPFLAAMAACAVVEQQWKDASAWIAGSALFCALFAVHLAKASQLHLYTDASSPGWAYFGGWRFAVRTVQSNNAVLAFLPDWISAMALLSSLVGFALAGDRMFRRAALIVGGYVVAFMFVGRSENLYWGLLFAPILPIGVPLAVRAWRFLRGDRIAKPSSCVGAEFL